ncbi:hypothetical protein VTK26DRAFT_9428 [Humicola hyalothermophila]
MAAPPSWFQEEQPFLDAQFDIFDWHPYFQSCVRYFVEHAQYNGPIQALAAFINIQLPFQRAAQNHLQLSRASPAVAAVAAVAAVPPSSSYPPTLLQPYIRRLVATGFDVPAVLHGFFGDDWAVGIRPLHERERRNYLFAAKSSSWLEVRRAYDMGADEAVPFLRPLAGVTEAEIEKAEEEWSAWLAMQDWMLGPRSLDAQRAASLGPVDDATAGIRVKQERND